MASGLEFEMKKSREIKTARERKKCKNNARSVIKIEKVNYVLYERKRKIKDKCK